MGKVADVVDDHRVMTAPAKVDRDQAPAVFVIGGFQLGDLGQRMRVFEFGVAGEDPDQAVALLGGEAADADVRKRLTEQLVRDLGDLAFAVVLPAVIHAHKVAALDLANRELDLTVRAAVLHGVDLAVVTAIHGDGSAPKLGAHRLALL